MLRLLEGKHTFAICENKFRKPRFLTGIGDTKILFSELNRDLNKCLKLANFHGQETARDGFKCLQAKGYRYCAPNLRHLC